MRPVHIQVGIGLCALLFVSVYAEAQVNETFKAIASDAAANDNFGRSVGVSGNIAVVGAVFADAGGLVDSGSAYLFDTTTGNQLFKLAAVDRATRDFFGFSSAVSGTTAIVGAIQSDGAANPIVDSGPGSAYVFDTTTGSQLFKLTASDAVIGDVFGWSTAIDGSLAVIGAPRNNVGAVAEAGAAYVFDTTTGSQLLKLTASDGRIADQFGKSVAVSGNLAIVGANFDDLPGGKLAAGSAYVFDLTTGNQLFKLTASDAAAFDNFGISVAISGNLAVVGASKNDDAGDSSGSAYVFDLTTGNQLFKLTAADAAGGDVFGISVAISGTTTVVGSIFADVGGLNAGAAYLFDATTGSQLAKLTASDAATSDVLGFSSEISGNTVVLGAFAGDAPAVNSGAAYIFNNIVPEPATLSLLALGGLAMLRRRD